MGFFHRPRIAVRPMERSEFQRLPEHVAIIMDGNGRWAKKHRLSVSLGHRQGMETVRSVIRHTNDLGIQSLSLYAFSTENWSRPRQEVEALMQILVEFITADIDKLDAKNVRVRMMGDKGRLPELPRNAMTDAEERTAGNTGMNLNLCINYGGRDELVRAAQTLARACAGGEMEAEAITEKAFSEALYTRGQPDVDLMIRTSGEMRLSNFLLWQCAYAEFVFPEKLWPDFTVQDYDRVLTDFSGRQRRFGGRV